MKSAGVLLPGVLFILLQGTQLPEPRELTFDQRVAAHHALEEVIWRHQIWPESSPSGKPPMDAVMTEADLRQAVENYLAQSMALEHLWGRPITSADLQTEIDRMVRDSREPRMLRELFTALGDDADLIAETLIRKTLADRLLRQAFAGDAAMQAESRGRAETSMSHHPTLAQMPAMGDDFIEITYRRQPPGNAVGRDPVGQTITLTVSEWDNLVESLADQFGVVREKPPGSHGDAPRQTAPLLAKIPVGAMGALQEDETGFYVSAVISKSSSSIHVAMTRWNKTPFDAWWAKTRPSMAMTPLIPSTSFLLDTSQMATACTTNTWSDMATSSLSARYNHAAVWTGAELLIWGGFSGSMSLASGARYAPATDTWTPISGSGAPSARHLHTAVWTGIEMIAWGGSGNGTAVSTGARYNPMTDMWSDTSVTAAPAARFSHTAAWTGSSMIVWGGENGSTSLNSGGRYNASGDSWTPTSATGAPTVRLGHTAVWTGTEMIIWGGFGTDFLRTGGRYNPGTNLWTNTIFEDSPIGRRFHAAVWTGAEMIVWGGENGSGPLGSGARYTPGTNAWLPVSTTSAPTARSRPGTVWTGAEMVVWGGTAGTFPTTGARYTPQSDTWAATSTTGAPSGRLGHATAWTGSEMLVWGGLGAAATDTGARYCLCPNSTTSYLDADGDGYGDPLMLSLSCDGTVPSGYVANSTDCNDANATINPAGNDAICDGVDQDCSGAADEDFVSGPSACGVGACAATGIASCIGGIPLDTCIAGSPTLELCDGLDNDCNGQIDNAVPPTNGPDLTLTRTGGVTQITWPAMPEATGYDVVRGTLDSLTATQGNFAVATDACLASNLPATSLEYAIDPPPGQGIWFLARGVNCAGHGSFDMADAGQIGSRDTEVEASATSCTAGVSIPTANAGPDQIVLQGSVVQLDGTGSSDPFNKPLTYQWAIQSTPSGSAATLSSPTSSLPTLQPDVVGDYVVSLVVRNGVADSLPDTVTVHALSGTLGLTALSPSSVKVGSPDTPLGVSGSGFVSGATVRLDGKDLATTFVSVAALSTTIPAAMLTSPGLLPVQVVNPGGTASAALMFTVTDDLALGAVRPVGAASGSLDFDLNLTGTGFQPGATVVFDGSDLVTTFVGTGSLTAAVPASAVSASRTVQVLVRNPGGLTTVSANFTIKPLSLTTVVPQIGPVGTLVDLTGDGFDLNPAVSFTKAGGGTIAGPALQRTASSVRVAVPVGAATGPLTLMSAGLALTGPTFTVPTSKTFDLDAAPSTATTFPGVVTRFAVSATSANGYASPVDLQVSGLPAGITATLDPGQVAIGQNSYLALTIDPNQPTGAVPFTLTGSSTFEGQTLVRTVNLTVDVQPVTTSFIGQCVASDLERTPLAGVTVRFLGRDPSGVANACSVPPVLTDGAGIFVFTNLPAACTGLQMVGFDGTTVTSPPGQVYAGVNLRFTIAAGVVTPAPVYTHLVRIDDAEQVLVAQSHPSSQIFTFATIPGLKVEVYAGTTFHLPDGSTPNPFPLIAASVATDRLPDRKDLTPGQVLPFIVAFQPADAYTDAPVAVDYPNTADTLPGTNLALLTLDPTQGMMVMYGTGTISPTGVSVVADADPNRPGRRYGISHFDWHGQMSSPPEDPAGDPPNACVPQTSGAGVAGGMGASSGSPGGGNSIKYSTGYEEFSVTDARIGGIPLPVALVRTYRGSPKFQTFQGSFGLGATHSFDFLLDVGAATNAARISIRFPYGRRVPFVRQANGTYTSVGEQLTGGAVLNWDAAAGRYRYVSVTGDVMLFQPNNQTSLLVRIEDRRGNAIDIRRDNTNKVLDLTASNGEMLFFSYDGGNRITEVIAPGGRRTTYSYDAPGRLATVRDPQGAETHYSYDTSNRLTAVTDARGITLVTKQYSAQDGRASREVFPDGSQVNYRFVEFNCFNTALGTLTGGGSPSGAALVGATPAPPCLSSGLDAIKEAYVFDTFLGDPNGRSAFYRFNIRGRLTDTADALGNTVSYKTDPVSGRTSAMHGSAGCTTCGGGHVGDESYEWDSKGRLAKRTDALGNETHFTYPAVGDQPLTITDALQRTTTFTRNSFGEVTEVIDPAGKTATFVYNTRGQVIEVTGPTLGTTTLEYGADLRVAAVTDPIGRRTEYAYDTAGNLTRIESPDGSIQALRYDRLGRVISIFDPLGAITRFTYDPVGNLTSLTDPEGNVTQWQHDWAGRVVREVSPTGAERLYQYDLRGDLVSFTDRNGRTHTFQYDRLGRLTRAAYQDGSVVTYGYDAAGRLASINDSAGGAMVYEYDLMSRPVRVTGPQGEITYTYDALGRRESMTGPDGTTTYGYALQGQLDQIAGPTLQVNLDYDDAGRLISEALPNGVAADYTYDLAGQLTGIDYSFSGGSRSRHYTHDSRGYVTSVEGLTVPPPVVSNQGIAIGPGNRIASVNGVPFVHDAEGRLISDGQRSYEWDDRGRLLSVTDGSGLSEYGYDALGRRARVADARGTLDYLWDAGDVSRVSDDTGRTRSFLRGLGLDSTYAEMDGTEVKTYLRDRVNTTFAVVDSIGSLHEIGAEEFGAAQTPIPGDPFFSFAGRERDVSGLLYFRARFYSEDQGMFISEDPLGFAGGGTNTYEFAANNPITFADPTGNCTCGGSSAALAAALGDNRDWSWPADRSDVNPHFGEGTNKCNLFVDTMFDQAGSNLPNIGGWTQSGRYPAGADSLSSPFYFVPGWPVVSGPAESGDLIAFGGHVGIVLIAPTGFLNGQTISASGGGKVISTFGFRPGNTPVLRRCSCSAEAFFFSPINLLRLR